MDDHHFGPILQQVQPLLMGQNLEKVMGLAGWIMLVAIEQRNGHYLNVTLWGFDLVLIMMLVLSVGMNKE